MLSNAKLVFISFSYWKIDKNKFLEHVLTNIENVEFLDLRNIFPELALKENSTTPFGEEKLPCKPTRFNSIKDFKNYLKNENIVVVNGFGEQNFNTWKLSYLLSKYNVPMIGIQNNSSLANILKKGTIEKVTKPNFFKKLLPRFEFMLYLFFLRWNFLSKYDIYFLSGAKLSNSILKYKEKYNEVIYVNSHTYDTFLTTRQEVTDNNYIVFLDIALPYIEDFKAWGMEDVDPDKYYKELNQFFDRLEDMTKKKVVVCAHPQFREDKRDIYFPNREVVWFKTNDYIPHASFVLVHYTNAIQYAVLYNKPILLLDSPTLNSYLKNCIKFCKENLNLKHIDYTNTDSDELENILQQLDVDNNSYREYKLNYLVNEGDEELSSYLKIIQTLKNRYNIK